MNKPDATVEGPIVARVVHRSVLFDQPGQRPVIKLMLNLAPQGRPFVSGADVGFAAPGVGGDGHFYRIGSFIDVRRISKLKTLGNFL